MIVSGVVASAEVMVKVDVAARGKAVSCVREKLCADQVSVEGMKRLTYRVELVADRRYMVSWYFVWDSMPVPPQQVPVFPYSRRTPGVRGWK